MVKKIISYIFICVSFMGCDNQIINPVESDMGEEINNSGYYLEIESQLEYDGNYYHMLFLDGYIQTFTTLTAKTGSKYKIQELSWNTDRQYNIEFWNTDNYTDLVNPTSYTDDGFGYTVFGPWEDFVNDTITVYCNYMDEYGLTYIDSLKIIIE
tara:strand:- start:197 stop:658 length:462 start_codon:yes stop_codon:yes gene_type:complete